MNQRTWTEEDRQWIVKNYPLLTHKDIMRHLQCGRDSLHRLMKEAGIEPVQREIHEPKAKKVAWYDEDGKGYCLDCKYYRKDGNCIKTGKAVGGLWFKKCLKIKKDERIRNNR